MGADQPPATHYELGEEGGAFYAEFLTPLILTLRPPETCCPTLIGRSPGFGVSAAALGGVLFIGFAVRLASI